MFSVELSNYSQSEVIRMCYDRGEFRTVSVWMSSDIVVPIVCGGYIFVASKDSLRKLFCKEIDDSYFSFVSAMTLSETENTDADPVPCPMQQFLQFAYTDALGSNLSCKEKFHISPVEFIAGHAKYTRDDRMRCWRYENYEVLYKPCIFYYNAWCFAKGVDELGNGNFVPIEDIRLQSDVKDTLPFLDKFI